MIEPTPGRPERRYCTAAHRAAARQARRASAHAASEPRLAAALPWVAEHGTDAAGGGTRLPEQRRVVAADDAGEPHPAGLGGSPRGRPPLPAPAAAPRPAEARSAAVAPSPPRQRPGVTGRAAAPPPRRRRALAVLGAAGILAGGYAVTGGEPGRAPVAPAQPAAAGDESQWAARAEVALAAVTRQLDAIAEVEAAWHNTPASMRAGTPAEVRALQERKDVLERRRLILRSQLDTFQQLQEVQIELRAAEQRLRDVERQLQHVPPPGRRSPQQQAEIAVLEEQRALQAQRRDAKAAELAGLTEGVENAARVPLPDDSAKTAAVNEDVREVIEGGGEPRKPGDVAPPRPDLVAGRDQEGDRPRAEAHTSAPPDPRGPGEDEPGNREGGPVGTVTDTVDGVAGTLTGARSGGDDDRGEDRSDGGGADRSDRGGDSDGGARSGDTVDDTPAGLTGVLEGGSDDGRGRRDSVRDARGEERRAGPAEAGADRLEKGAGIAPAAQDRPGPRVRPAPRTLPVPAPAPVPSIAPAWAAEAAPFRSAPAAPSGGRRISAEQAATARAVVASVPAGWSAAPALEAAIAQQEHAHPAASPSSAGSSPIGRDDPGSSPTGSSANGGPVTGRSPDRGWADPGRGPGGADPGSDSGGADSDGADSDGADSDGADSDGADSDGADSDGADSGGPDSGSASDASDSGSASDGSDSGSASEGADSGSGYSDSDSGGAGSDSGSDSGDADSGSDSGGSDSGGSDSDSGGADSGSDWSDSH